MRRTRLAVVCFGVIGMTATFALAGERKDVPDKYKWNLADLYPSEAVWTKAKDELSQRLPELAKFRGHLGKSPKEMLAALQAMFDLDRDLSRLSVYANSLSDEDLRAARPREMKQAAEELATAFSSACSWVRPEILTLDPAKVRKFVAQEPKLGPYRVYLEETLRRKPHTLGAAEERVAAEAGELERAGGEVHGVLSNADLPYPTIKLSTGESVRLDASAFTLHRQERNRADREKVFASFFGALKTYERTMGATLAAAVKSHLFEKRVRHFDSALQAALFQDNIPTTVYKQLLSDVHRSLPTLHRYLTLRKRMLGVDVLRYQDLYVPLVASVDMHFEPDEARAITLDALAPLGKEYTEALRKGFESRWTDYLPSTGKRSGAYSTGVYGVHPYQLLNFNGRYEDLTTLAHESGHSMHTFLSHGAQPYPTADYPIFVAEVASTFNENLLIHYMLDRAKDDATRLFLLGTLLDGLRTTLFRQTQFAEFELAFHEQAERGEPLTGENLSTLYLKIARDYYGHDKKVCQVDDLLAIEWAYVPHFYYDFYVYQYATSMVASTSLARAVRQEAKTGKTARRDAYLKMLASGSASYAIDLLKAAGVDMTTSAPFDAAIAEMNATMDELEKIVDRQAKPGAAPPAKH
ncbi:MAG TPA: oligoendopeptidase F [Polyangia bacterium]|jgi:oligoendopeptidase F|nr:oligoendopeptidase F [Polyangia bacterium]